MTSKDVSVIGRVEHISFLDTGTHDVPAKIDTGADLSSVWASAVKESDNQLTFQLFGKGSPYFTGETIKLNAGDFRLTRIENSFGVAETRYVVKLRIKVKGKIIKSSFSLANREAKVYPVLLGRRMLKSKFLVDVSKGRPLLKEEKQRLRQLKAEMAEGDE